MDLFADFLFFLGRTDALKEKTEILLDRFNQRGISLAEIRERGLGWRPFFKPQVLLG